MATEKVLKKQTEKTMNLIHNNDQNNQISELSGKACGLQGHPGVHTKFRDLHENFFSKTEFKS
jgi:GMP synthase-like glutamine amidotransferase